MTDLIDSIYSTNLGDVTALKYILGATVASFALLKYLYDSAPFRLNERVYLKIKKAFRDKNYILLHKFCYMTLPGDSPHPKSLNSEQLSPSEAFSNKQRFLEEFSEEISKNMEGQLFIRGIPRNHFMIYGKNSKAPAVQQDYWAQKRYDGIVNNVSNGKFPIFKDNKEELSKIPKDFSEGKWKNFYKRAVCCMVKGAAKLIKDNGEGGIEDETTIKQLSKMSLSDFLLLEFSKEHTLNLESARDLLYFYSLAEFVSREEEPKAETEEIIGLQGIDKIFKEYREAVRNFESTGKSKLSSELVPLVEGFENVWNNY